MQSHEGFLRLLPAVPTQWKTGCAKGIRARGGYTAVDGFCPILSGLTDVQMVNGMADVRHGAVGMVMMVMEVFVLFVTVDCHGDMGTFHPAFDGGLCGNVYTGQTYGVHGFQKCRRIGQQLQQRCHEHIAGSAHIAFQIECFHPVTPMWLIILAR